MAGNTAPISQRARMALALLCVCVGCAAAAPSAYAARTPVVTLTLPRAVSEGAAIPFSWTGRHLGRNHRLVIQRPVGTAHTWQTMMKLPSNSGSSELPGMALGKYRLRLADLSGRRVLAKQAVGIGVFGQVPLSTLLGASTQTGVYATPQFSFPYVDKGGGGESHNLFKVTDNNCLSVHVAFVTEQHDISAVTTVTLVQESREAVSASATGEAIGSLDAELVPSQSWAITLTLTPNLLDEVYFNGYAVCDSTESFF
jgi:hypothetical protein